MIQFGGFQQSLPSLVVARQVNHEGFLITIEQTVNSPLGEVFPRHRFAAVQIIHDMGFDERDGHLQERHVDELAAPGLHPREQRRHDAVGGEYAGGMIDERNTRDFGIVEIGHQAHHPAQRLTDGVETGPVAVGAVLAVAGDRTVD